VRKRIKFYRVADTYGEFSNFAPFPIMLAGERWPTSEHYYQAQKFEDPAARERIRKARSPMQAAAYGRDPANRLRPDWERVKDDVMYTAVRAKFAQHTGLRKRLLATGNAILIEHTRHDRYWGDGGDGTGRNMLGSILMRVREELRGSHQMKMDEP
jgi:ribA/ribD-fused uncharacterized protein